MMCNKREYESSARCVLSRIVMDGLVHAAHAKIGQLEDNL